MTIQYIIVIFILLAALAYIVRLLFISFKNMKNTDPVCQGCPFYERGCHKKEENKHVFKAKEGENSKCSKNIKEIGIKN